MSFSFDLCAADTGFLQIHQVGPVAGSEAFLLVNEQTAVLFDSGYGFCAEQMVAQIEIVLGARALDYVLLTHSHYDHALGSPACKARWPQVQIVASAYAAHIFAKDGAQATMREMDGNAARLQGISEYVDWTTQLHVDVPAEDGDEFWLGDQRMLVTAMPGHTRCSVGYWFPDSGLLLASESPGVYGGGELIAPAAMVGYGMTMSTIARAQALQPRHMLVPHTGLLHGEACMQYLEKGAQALENCREVIVAACRAGLEDARICEELKKHFYDTRTLPGQPEAAFMLNAGYQIALMRKECM